MPSFDLIHTTAHGVVRDDLRCTSCKLADHPDLTTNCMSGTGPKRATFLFAGHAPGVEDDRIGSAFTGGNGRLLRELLRESSIDESSVRFTNTLRCAPFETKPSKTHWKACKGHFQNELREVQPQAIVSFGATAWNWLTGQTGVRRFRRIPLPCVLNPKIPVYGFEQALTLQHLTGQDYYRARARFVSDFCWLRQQALQGNLKAAEFDESDYKTAKTLDDVRAFLTEFSADSEVYADLETADQNYDMAAFPHPGNRIVMLGFGNRPGHARMIPYQARGLISVTYWTAEEEAEVKELLRAFWTTHSFIGHNFVQFDQKWICVHWGLPKLDIRFEPMLAAHLLDEEAGGHGLEALAIRYCGLPPWKQTFTVQDTLKCAAYNGRDIDAGVRVTAAIRAALEPVQVLLHEQIQVPLAHEARLMEQVGVEMDTDAMENLGVQLRKIIEETGRELASVSEVRAWQLKNGALNLDSTHHLRDLMQNYFRLPKMKETDTGLYSTDREVLEHYEDDCEFVRLLLRHRRATKLLGTYYEGPKEIVEKHGTTMHYFIKLHGTVTGRPSFSDPNVGNIPRKDTAQRAGLDDPALVKAMFKARAGCCFLEADYSQIELRVLAMLSRDENLTQFFCDGLDAHQATAAKLFQVPLAEVTSAQRTRAKMVNFGLIYGKQEPSLKRDFVTAAREKERQTSKAEDRPMNFTREMEQEAERIALEVLAQHQATHPGVWRWMRHQEHLVRTQGYQETVFGRRRHYWKVDNEAVRQALNFPVQSTAADITHTAIITTAHGLRELGLHARAALTVYDSIVFEVALDDLWKTARLVKDAMESLDFSFVTVPLVVDLKAGLSWGRLKTIDAKAEVVHG